VKDELAARRAVKGIATIRIAAGDASVVKHVALRPEQTVDPIATIKARRRRRKMPKPV
jgi:hypothetical protein